MFSVSSVAKTIILSQDVSAPPLNTLYFYLTEGCNLRCRHCWIAPAYQTADRIYPMLRVGLFKSILEQAAPLGLSGVKLTGGEPLLHPDILALLAIIRERGLSLIVETNGVLCTPDIAEAIAQCAHPFVSVSVDGADAGTHDWVRGVPGSFKAALDGIRTLAAAGLRPQIIMTIMRRTVAQVEPMARLAEELGAGSVKFNLVQPTARGEVLRDADETLHVEELLDLGRRVEAEIAPAASIPVFYSHPPAFRPLSRMFGPRGDGCAVCGIFGILGVLADGLYALCGIGKTVPDLVFGHADRDRLDDVWRTTPILQHIREGLPQRLTGVCAQCLMQAHCLGSCLAQNYYRAHDLWAPFWFCQEAYEQGLFPETRLKTSRPVPSAA